MGKIIIEIEGMPKEILNLAIPMFEKQFNENKTFKGKTKITCTD